MAPPVPMTTNTIITAYPSQKRKDIQQNGEPQPKMQRIESTEVALKILKKLEHETKMKDCALLKDAIPFTYWSHTTRCNLR